MTKIREAREARETAGDAGEAGDVGSGSRSAKKTSLLGALSDDSDSDSDSDADADAKPKKPKKKVLSVLPDDGGDDSSDDEAVPKIVRAWRGGVKTSATRGFARAQAGGEGQGDEGQERGERARTKQAPLGRDGRATNGGGEKRRFEKRPASFGDGGKKKKKPRHPDGRHALNAAATLAGKGNRERSSIDASTQPAYKIFLNEGPCA